MNDRGSIKLGPVCQMDVTSSDNPEDDSIPTVMYIRVEKDAASQEDISVGVTFSETRMWVARMDIPVEAAQDVGAVRYSGPTRAISLSLFLMQTAKLRN